jgi:hypothetical protein
VRVPPRGVVHEKVEADDEVEPGEALGHATGVRERGRHVRAGEHQDADGAVDQRVGMRDI